MIVHISLTSSPSITLNIYGELRNTFSGVSPILLENVLLYLSTNSFKTSLASSILFTPLALSMKSILPCIILDNFSILPLPLG